jgi:hypothetical protein
MFKDFKKETKNRFSDLICIDLFVLLKRMIIYPEIKIYVTQTPSFVKYGKKSK